MRRGRLSCNSGYSPTAENGGEERATIPLDGPLI
jgi:hypothetical protein